MTTATRNAPPPISELLPQFAPARLKVAEILHLGTMAPTGALGMAYRLEDWLEGNDPNGWAQAFLTHPAHSSLQPLLADFNETGVPDAEALLGWFVEQRLTGFLVEFHCKDPRPRGEKPSGWDRFRAEFFYADTLEETMARALDWAHQVHGMEVAR